MALKPGQQPAPYWCFEVLMDALNEQLSMGVFVIGITQEHFLKSSCRN